ncbi:MAG: DUF697 domain-containing protein [Gloeomargaritaceae cyanobacterium C42_A2020_066]|nr:DUF697 domain-containing protein [Gloeomargaritaceae cyanobacterium C42_A2020_066]
MVGAAVHGLLHRHQATLALESLHQQWVALGRPDQALTQALTQLETLTAKLKQGRFTIAAVGLVGRGKSSLLNGLLGRPAFAAGPQHGVTRSAQRVDWLGASAWSVEHLTLGLLDTPGLDEVAGEDRENQAVQVALDADLILFVVAGDPNRVEHCALEALTQAGKPVILVFNKSDQYRPADHTQILAKLHHLPYPLRGVVTTAAAPTQVQAVARPDGGVDLERVATAPDLAQLTGALGQQIAANGHTLLALNVLAGASRVQSELLRHRAAHQSHQAGRLIRQAAQAKALGVALNPFTGLDLVAGAGVDTALILRLAHHYGVPMTQSAALELLRQIALGLGGLGLGEWIGRVGLGAMRGSLGVAVPLSGGAAVLPYLAVGLAQGALAGVMTVLIGRAAQQYLLRGATWGPAGLQAVLRDVLQTLEVSRVRAN